jgi:hypothetical protein
MVNRPQEMSPFEFIAIATLRAAQLVRGCGPRVPSGHKFTTTAQLEVIAGLILKLPQPPTAATASWTGTVTSNRLSFTLVAIPSPGMKCDVHAHVSRFRRRS